MVDLHDELEAATQASQFIHFKHLVALGVSQRTAANLRNFDGDGWGVVNASKGEDGLYLLGQGGSLHLVLPVCESGELVDLVAFRSSDPDDWMLRTGLGWALGVGGGLERYTWGFPAMLHVTPLDWLKADCDGLCILNWDAPELQYLKTLPDIVCATDRLASRLATALKRDPHFPNITVMPSGGERQAA